MDFGDAKAAGLYRAVYQYEVDGDTADFLIDLGLYQYAYTSVRVIGVDTPELAGVPAEVQAADWPAKRAPRSRSWIARCCSERPYYRAHDPHVSGRPGWLSGVEMGTAAAVCVEDVTAGAPVSNGRRQRSAAAAVISRP